jgi:hypothetical protein
MAECLKVSSADLEQTHVWEDFLLAWFGSLISSLRNRPFSCVPCSFKQACASACVL